MTGTVSKLSLSKREKMFTHFFRNTPEAIGIADAETGILLECNMALAKLVGRKKSELVGQPQSILHPPEDIEDGFSKTFLNHLELKKWKTIETRVITKTGKIKYVQISANVIMFDGQKLVQGIFHDITDRKKLEEALRRRAEEMTALQATVLGITSSTSLTKLLQKIVEQATDLLDASSGGLYLTEPEHQRVRCVVSYNTAKDFTGTTLAYGEGAAGHVAQAGKPLLIDDYRKWSGKAEVYKSEESFQSIISAPMIWQGKVLGVIHVLRERKGGKFSQENLDLLSLFADHAAVAVQNARLYESLQESESRFRDLFNSVPVGIYRSTPEGRFLDGNPAIMKILGYPDQKTMLNANIKDLYLEDSIRDQELTLIEQDDFVRNHRMQLRRYDGTVIWVQDSANAVRNGSGQVLYYSGRLEDITEQVKAEKALRESEDRYRTIVTSIPLVTFVTDDKGIFLLSEGKGLSSLGLKPGEVVGMSVFDVYKEFPDIIEDMNLALAGKLVRSETMVQGVTFDVSYTPIKDSTGKVERLIGVAIDITERKQSEQALQTKTNELEALFSISSHLRTAQSADAMLATVLQEMQRVLKSDANAIILLDPDGEHFTFTVGDGPLSENVNKKFDIDGNICGIVLKTKEPYITKDLSFDSKKSNTVQGTEKLGPTVAVPVVSEDKFLGVLICARNKSKKAYLYTQADVQLITAIGEMVGNALRRARLYDQALNRLQNVQALHSIDMAISANMDLSVVLDVLLTHGSTQLDVDAASVLLLEPHTHTLEYAAGYGFRTKTVEHSRLRIGEGLPGQVALKREPLYVPDISKDAMVLRKKLLDEDFVSYQAAPLIAKGQLQGVLEIFTRTPMIAVEEQRSFFETLATQAAIAINNTQLFNDLQRSNFELEMAYDATIEGWSRALELRDQETEGHTLRVAETTVQLAQMMGVNGIDLVHMRRGALLHDIGKMGVPDHILLKPSKFDPDEWEIMKLHTTYAFEMLWPIEFLRPATDIPYCHHERWDGTGYPRQLKGEQIPFSARVFAIVDVWDALTSDRPYRKAWTENKALEYITANNGKHFDPQVVETFLMWKNESN